MTDYQVRYDGGALIYFPSLAEALQFRDGDWDKVSWAVGAGRLILRKDSWEWLKPPLSSPDK